MTGKALYTVAEAAELCSTTEKAFRHWITNGAAGDPGGVPPAAVHRIGRLVRIKGWWIRQFTEEPAEAAS